MKQSYAVNMIRRQVKQRMTRVKLERERERKRERKREKERERKKFFTIVALKQPNSSESILTVYRYSGRLSTRTLSPKVLCNNISL